MTTSKQFEQAYITLSMMTKIKLTTKKGKGNLFTIECYMPSFEPQNETFCKHMLQINKLLNKLPLTLLCTIRIAECLFDCRVLPQQGCNGATRSGIWEVA